MLQKSARDLLARVCPTELVRELMATETAHDNALWQEIADQGWTGLHISEEFGGLGLSAIELAVVAEETGRACLPGAFLSNILATTLVEKAGNTAQKEKYLEKLALGEIKATVAMLEKSADWSPEAVKLEAKRDGENLSVSGKKMFVSDAETADLIICVAREGENFVILPIEKSAEGVKITALPSLDATRKLYEIEFENVNVASSEVLGADGDVLGALNDSLDVATVALCAEMVGAMQKIMEMSVEYAKTRHQFGKPIGTYQAVQHQCADMLLFTESARSATLAAAWAVANNTEEARYAVSVAKAYTSDGFREVANRGVQVHGGIGFTWEHDLQLFYKRHKSSEVLFGDATFHRERIARIILDGELKQEKN